MTASRCPLHLARSRAATIAVICSRVRYPRIGWAWRFAGMASTRVATGRVVGSRCAV